MHLQILMMLTTEIMMLTTPVVDPCVRRLTGELRGPAKSAITFPGDSI